MNLKNLMMGDKGSGLLFNVVVDHSKRVLFVQDPVYATINDKISVKYNDLVNSLIAGEILPNITYKIRTGDEENDFILLSTCYLIADGGYINIAQIISGFGSCETNRVKYKFTDWVASVRKDVECFFGILKKRFRWFKVPSLLRNIEDIRDVFKTACIIHNMILSYDGLDKLWENDANWKPLDTISEEDVDIEDTNAEDDENTNYLNEYAPVIHDDANFVPISIGSLIPLQEIESYNVQDKNDIIRTESYHPKYFFPYCINNICFVML